MYYTKYRPQKFNEVAKPNDVAQALSTQLKSGKTAHAYLFVGSRGTGKTTMARLLAKALNCKKLDEDGDPCNECTSCLAIQTGSFMDLIEIDAASNRGIDDIRELKEKIKLVPGKGNTKVYIVDEVHMLTTEAFNALLKTLEEPPARIVFILCTTEYHKVPETIRSRCQVFKFKKATISQLTEKLKKIIKTEKVDLDEQSIKRIASAAQGGYRDAETLLQQVVEGEIPVEALISLGSQESHAIFTDFLIAKDSSEALHFVSKLNDDGIDLYVWIGELLNYLRDLLFIKTKIFSGDGLSIDENILKTMNSQAETLSFGVLSEIMEIMITAQNKVKDTFIVQLPLELAIVKICNGSEDEQTKRTHVIKPYPGKNLESSQEEKTLIEAAKTEIKKEKADIESTAKIEQVVDESAAINGIDEKIIVSHDVVISKWSTIIKEVSTVNNSISALLRASKLTSVEGNKIILEVPYDFHKERLHNEKNRRIVETTIESVLEQRLIISCVVKKTPKVKKSEKKTGQLTDFNLVSPGAAKIELSEDLLDVFDGSLPQMG